MQINKNYLKPAKEEHLHSPAHVLADELSLKLNDRKNFGFYLKTALSFDHNVLRRIAGEVLEQKTAKNPGALFAFLLKKFNRENPYSTGYSLWLVPNGVHLKSLEELVKKLSDSTRTPAFRPHLTLLGNLADDELTLLNNFENLAQKLKPLDLELGPINPGDSFFQAIYVDIKLSPELKKTRLLARKIFSDKKPGKYQPHVSLLYANLQDNLKQDMIKNLLQPLPNPILFDEIALVKTTGLITEFKTIKTIKLT
jgi:hypothetical protein